MNYADYLPLDSERLSALERDSSAEVMRVRAEAHRQVDEDAHAQVAENDARIKAFDGVVPSEIRAEIERKSAESTARSHAAIDRWINDGIAQSILCFAILRREVEGASLH